jgi:hypothetical protein
MASFLSFLAAGTLRRAILWHKQLIAEDFYAELESAAATRCLRQIHGLNKNY